jgi:alkanesulfonate monooxygenase SsuD/methylene tetrahydromethanopterin reductase-like flavin-dependent oxidoreductase (luciferase family)
MRIGVSLRSSYPVIDLREGARWMIERARAARDAQLDSLFVGDHHSVMSGGLNPDLTPVPYYQNVPIMGRLLAEWGDRPSGVLVLLPLWNPVLVAEQVGTLASIASGRFIMQCAIGAGRSQFAAMGVALRDRVRLFEDGLETIRRLLEGADVDGARISPIAPEPVEVWIGAQAPRAIDRAARLGDAWLAGPDAAPGEARDLAALYLERCDVHDRTPTAVAIRRDVHVGASDDEAHRVADPVLERGYRGFDTSATIVGGPETVAERLAELRAMGYTDVIVRHLADDQSAVLRSLELLGSVRAGQA